jgi:hypothetical protein
MRQDARQPQNLTVSEQPNISEMLDFEAGAVFEAMTNAKRVRSPDVEMVNPTSCRKTESPPKTNTPSSWSIQDIEMDESYINDERQSISSHAWSEPSIPSAPSIHDMGMDNSSVHKDQQSMSLRAQSMTSLPSDAETTTSWEEPSDVTRSCLSSLNEAKRTVSPEIDEEHRSKRLKSDAPPKKSSNSKLPTLLPRSPKLVIGISRSATASRKLKQSMMDGSFVISPQKQRNYEQEIQLVDREAAFQYGNTWTVYHSQCGKWFTMSEAYNTTKFKLHAKSCKASSGKTSTIDAWAKKLGWKVKDKTLALTLAPVGKSNAATVLTKPSVHVAEVEVEQLKPPHYVPCPGIAAKTDPRVAVYILRTGAGGGGARSVTAIARERFGLPFHELDDDNQDVVRALQQHEHTWRNDHTNKVVFSTKCNTRVDPERQCCERCLNVLNSSAFKNALRVPLPPNANYKFLNRQYRNDSLGLIYAKSAGLQELFEDKVCLPMVYFIYIG